MMPQLRPPAQVRAVAWTRVLMPVTLAIAVALLIADFKPIPHISHAAISSAPLAIAGICYAVLQFQLKPPRTVLLKRLMLAATFVLWAIDQLLPAGTASTFIGDVVIAAYVLDLFWLMQEQTGAAVLSSDAAS